MKTLNKIIAGSIAAAAALVLSASTTQANLLVNGDFETSPAGFTANPITPATANQGWATFGAVTRTNMFGSPVDSPESGSYALIEQNAVGNNWNPAGAYQIDGGITAGQTYTFSIWDITDTGTTYGTPVDLSLTFNDSTVTNNIGVAAVPPQSPNNNGFKLANGSPVANNANGWIQYSVTATAPAGAQYAIVYAMFMDNGQTTTENMYFDNANLVATPEPSTMALVGMGLAVPFYLIRRRKS